MDSIEFANLRINGLKRQQLLSLFAEKNDFNHITTVNAEFIVLANNNERFKKIINNSIATIDGQWPFFIAKLKNPAKKIEKISGNDLIYDVINFSKKNNLKIFLLGDTEYVNTESVKVLKENYGVEADGYSPPFQPYPFDSNINDEINKKIQAFSPHFLIVGFGAPKQEFWIDDNQEFLKHVGIKWAMGLGGTFRFISKVEHRAPKFVSVLGLEGIWRMVQNPKRFYRFYESLKFFKYV